MILIYVYEIFSQYNMYFLSNRYFAKFLNMTLLSTLLSLKP